MAIVPGGYKGNFCFKEHAVLHLDNMKSQKVSKQEVEV